MESCRVYLLGSPYVTVGEQLVEFKRKKALALLAYLALQAQPCRRDTILTLLWSDLDEERARAALRRTLATITETPLRQWLQADRHMIEQDWAMCREKFPHLRCRPLAAQFMNRSTLALFQFDWRDESISLTDEKHYQLVPAADISAEDLAGYASE